MATISWYGVTDHIQALNGSGIGFYGNSFGASVEVGAWQSKTFITNSNGTTAGPELNSITWTHPNSGSINGGASLSLLAIPNYLATINARFTHSSPVKTQNVKLRIYDRSNINNNPSGVICRVAEIIHPNTTQTVTGSGSSSWVTPTGSSNIMDLTSSPGQSGLRPLGSETTDMRHDTYLALTANPSSIGSKTFAGYLSLEYL